jgi:adenylate cyclase
VTRSPWRLRVALFLAVGFGVTGIWLVAYGTTVFRELDLDTVDWRFSIRGEKDADQFAVVAIDDVTFDKYETYPLARRIHARVIRRLKADGARLIAYDIQFSEPAPDAVDDNALMDSARAAANVVFATTEVAENGDRSSSATNTARSSTRVPESETGTSSQIRAASSVESRIASTASKASQ